MKSMDSDKFQVVMLLVILFVGCKSCSRGRRLWSREWRPVLAYQELVGGRLGYGWLLQNGTRQEHVW